MKHCITWWVGLDDSADKIDIAIFQNQEEEPREEIGVSTDDRSLGRLIKKLKSLSGKVRCVYEAGVCGYELQRLLSRRGIECDVVAPSLTPRRPGDRVKTNRRDARKLAKLHRAGELTTILIPNEQQEALRDLMRAREDVLEDVTRRRHRLTKFLLRHGHKYRLGRAWTQGHWQWLAQLRFEDPSLQMVLEQYRLSLDQALEQLKTFDQEVEALAQRPEFARLTRCLMGFRGIKAITAMTILAEAVDLRRYVSAPALMSAIGLVPSEYSTGAKERRGSITKTGNAHMRRVVVEASWHYRHSPIASKALKQRRRELPPEILRLVQRADQRLHKKFRKLVNKGKPSTVAVVGVARELAGFIWAVGQAA
jgi:transposase